MLFITMNLYYAIMISALSDAKIEQDVKARQQWKKNKSQMMQVYAWLNTNLQLEHRFKTCFRGVWSRYKRRKEAHKELEAQREEEYALKMALKQPQQDTEAALGPASPALGR